MKTIESLWDAPNDRPTLTCGELAAYFAGRPAYLPVVAASKPNEGQSSVFCPVRGAVSLDTFDLVVVG